MTQYVEIEGWTAFEEQFKPKKNHLNKHGELQYETYGDDWEFIKTQDPRYVWTWVQGDMSDLLVNGIAYVNRLSYYVCEVPWDEDKDYCVLLSVEVECECYDEDRMDNGGEYGDPDCGECEGYGLVTKYVGE
jgi:hypothetical protein